MVVKKIVKKNTVCRNFSTIFTKSVQFVKMLKNHFDLLYKFGANGQKKKNNIHFNSLVPQ